MACINRGKIKSVGETHEVKRALLGAGGNAQSFHSDWVFIVCPTENVRETTGERSVLSILKRNSVQEE
jgi:hypothetical protein